MSAKVGLLLDWDYAKGDMYFELNIYEGGQSEASGSVNNFDVTVP